MFIDMGTEKKYNFKNIYNKGKSLSSNINIFTRKFCHIILHDLISNLSNIPLRSLK